MVLRATNCTTGLIGVALCVCLPDNPPVDTESGTAASDTSQTTDPTGGADAGLFGCGAPPCTVLLVSQTLDDRIDVHDVTATPYLRGRIGTDLKPDPTGLQTEANLLDEPYGLALDGTRLWAAIGHYPDTDRGSLVAFPRAAFDALPVGGVFTEDMYFQAGSFKGGVEAAPLERQEAIFLLPHPSGRLLVGVFANNLRAADWTEPSEILVIDPANLASIGAFDLGTIDPAPCVGGWKLEPLNADVSRFALACDGSESVAVVSLPADFATASPIDAAAGMSACGLNLGGVGSWTSQFVAADGAGGLIAIQSQLTGTPRVWSVGADCAPSGPPGMDIAPELASVRLLREPVLVRPGGGGTVPMWLVASSPPMSGVLIVRGGAAPEICGALTGLDVIAADNAPWALALDATRTHLAIGAGPSASPELAEGRGQVLWAGLDLSGLDDCKAAATAVVDLTEGTFQSADPRTWVRAPNVLVVAELGGA